MVTIVPRVGSWNDASRMATVQSLVEQHTFKIDQSVFVDSGDKVFVNGHFYSDKPVGPSVLGALVYWPLYHLGISLDRDWNFAYYLITLFLVKGFWVAGLLAFYGALKQTSLDAEKRFWLTASLAVASLYLTWGATFNNHILAASQLMIGFYFLLKAKQTHSVRLNLFLAGFFLSLAGAMDMPAMAFFVTFSGYVLLHEGLRRNILFYLLPFTLTFIPGLLVNYYISGSIMPLQLTRAYFDYPGSPWIGSDKLSGMGINQGVFFFYYSISALFGPRGFIWYNPFLFIALPYLFLEIGKKRAFMQEASVIGATSLIIVLYYLLFTNNHGGWSYSIRWFVPMLPMLFFFMYPFFENFNSQRRRIFFMVFVFSSIIAGIGLINPWSIGALSNMPVLSNLIEFQMLLER
jgi:hypothetical protein